MSGSDAEDSVAALLQAELQQKRRRRSAAWAAATGGALLAGLALCLAFLLPRTPQASVVWIETTGRPVVRLAPLPELWIPLRLTAALRNDCFYALRAAPGSRLAAFFSSALLGRSVLLGQADDAALLLPARSLSTAVLDATGRYAFFESPAVLGEMAAQCVANGRLAIEVRLELMLEALASRFALNVSVPYEFAC
jgi:hypothetical protein